MPGFNILFFATREEIVKLILESMNKYGAYGFAMRFNPFSAVKISKMNETDLLSPESLYSFVMLTMRNKDVQIRSQFPVEYDDKIYMPLPRIINNRLGQLQFGLRLNRGDGFDEESAKIWNKIARDIRKITKTGVRLYWIDDNILTEPDRSIRYTNGAKEAYRHGITLGFANAGLIGKIDD